jgi:hypothetical protein
MISGKDSSLTSVLNREQKNYVNASLINYIELRSAVFSKDELVCLAHQAANPVRDASHAPS